MTLLLEQLYEISLILKEDAYWIILQFQLVLLRVNLLIQFFNQHIEVLRRIPDTIIYLSVQDFGIEFKPFVMLDFTHQLS